MFDDLQGGIAFVAIKGVLRIYFKQQQYTRQAQRLILDFHEPEVIATSSQTAARSQQASTQTLQQPPEQTAIPEP